MQLTRAKFSAPVAYTVLIFKISGKESFQKRFHIQIACGENDVFSHR